MDVLHPPTVRSRLGMMTQDNPIDLRTGGHIFHTSILERHQDIYKSPYPHIDFHRTSTSNQLASTPEELYYNSVNTGISHPSKHPPSDDSQEKEPSKLKYYTPLPKKRRFLETEEPDDTYTASKRLKVHQPTEEKKISETYPPLIPTSTYYNRFPSLPNTESVREDIEKSEELLKYFSGASSPFAQCYSPNSFSSNEAILERIRSSVSVDSSPTSIKETESLLAAVQQSQMLYYTYCTQLLHNLQARRLMQEHEYIKQTLKPYSMPDLRVGNSGVESMEKLESFSSECRAAASQSPTLSLKRKIECESPSSTLSQPSSYPTSSSLNASSSSNYPASPSSAPSSTTGEERSLSQVGTVSSHGRRRAPRALTGKHVRPGTGAAPSTLVTLRQALAIRQRKTLDESSPERRVHGKHGKSSKR